ncbi:MAG: hypothetical protein ACOWWM_18435 [Desulfobacterales bacterium]
MSDFTLTGEDMLKMECAVNSLESISEFMGLGGDDLDPEKYGDEFAGTLLNYVGDLIFPQVVELKKIMEGTGYLKKNGQQAG